MYLFKICRLFFGVLFDVIWILHFDFTLCINENYYFFKHIFSFVLLF